MSELPAGWVVCQLSDIGHIVTGKTPNTKEPRFYGGEIPFIKPGDLDHSGPVISTEVYLTGDGLAEAPALPPDSIVVTCIGNLGKVGITTKPSASNQQINAIVPDQNVDPTYIFHYCKTLKPWLESESSATTISIVNKGIFSTAPVPLPPLAEQTRIAQKLDELLAQVDTLKARIDAIPALLKRFRQSVLAAAVSGRLTEKCREQSAVPARKQIGELFEIVSGPAFKKEQYSTEGSRLLQIANIGYGYTTWETVNYIPMSLAKLEHRFELQAGDIVMALNRPITNGSLKTAKITDQDLPASLYQRVARFRQRTKKNLNSNYVFLCFKTDDFRKQVQKELQGSDQPYINTSSLKNLEVYFPQADEQTEIVRRVEQLFAFADQLEAKVASAKSRIDHLTQSTLAKAFRGELVAQVPHDEPASVLLERIKAQRAAAPKTKHARKNA